MNEERIHENKMEPAPWGFWPTIGFSFVIGIVYALIQAIVVVLFVVTARLRDTHVDIENLAYSLQSNGFVLAIAACVSAPFAIGLSIVFAKIRRQTTLKEYFALKKVGWKEISKWLLAVLLFGVCQDTITFLLGRPIVPEFMIDTYKTAYFTPLLWLALIVAAPLAEETFFRGFLFKGIQSSKAGTLGAILITSLIWSVTHLQYDIYGIVFIFMGGLLLGFARSRSSSIYPPIIMHTLQNIVATVEVVIALKLFSGNL